MASWLQQQKPWKLTIILNSTLEPSVILVSTKSQPTEVDIIKNA